MVLNYNEPIKIVTFFDFTIENNFRLCIVVVAFKDTLDMILKCLHLFGSNQIT